MLWTLKTLWGGFRDIVDIVDIALWMLWILWTLMGIVDSVDVFVKGYHVGRSPHGGIDTWSEELDPCVFFVGGGGER